MTQQHDEAESIGWALRFQGCFLLRIAYGLKSENLYYSLYIATSLFESVFLLIQSYSRQMDISALYIIRKLIGASNLLRKN